MSEGVAAGSSGRQSAAKAGSGDRAHKELELATLLVPVDFSAPSRHAFEYALELAERFDSRICLLHVVKDQSSPEVPAIPRCKGGALAPWKEKLLMTRGTARQKVEAAI